MNFDTFSEMESDALVECIARALERERSSVIEIVMILAEIRRRSAHLELGFSSLVYYCLDGLNMEKSMAYRRSTGAELITTYPAIVPFFTSRRISLSTLVPLKKILTGENHLQILERMVGRTEEDAERFVATWLAKPIPGDSVRRLPTRVVEAPALFEGGVAPTAAVQPDPVQPIPCKAPTATDVDP